ncbi:Trypsin Inhibitor like cysteine rich domain [Popillia japonica]
MLKISCIVLVFLAVISVAVSQFRPIECNKPNEVYGCGSACQRECKTLGERCQIINAFCNDACYCVEGYARDNEGTCIPISQCPPKY